MNDYFIDQAPSLKQSVLRLIKSARRVQRQAKSTATLFTLGICVFSAANTSPRATAASIAWNAFTQILYLIIVLINLKMYRQTSRDEEIACRMTLATSVEEFDYWMSRLTQKNHERTGNRLGT